MHTKFIHTYLCTHTHTHSTTQTHTQTYKYSQITKTPARNHTIMHSTDTLPTCACAGTHGSSRKQCGHAHRHALTTIQIRKPSCRDAVRLEERAYRAAQLHRRTHADHHGAGLGGAAPNLARSIRRARLSRSRCACPSARKRAVQTAAYAQLAESCVVRGSHPAIVGAACRGEHA